MAGKSKTKTLRREYRGAAMPSRPSGAPPAPVSHPPAERRLWLPLSIFVLLISGGFLFFRLGHYLLWDDEASTALYARGVARTGDTLCLQGHNLYAYRDGTSLKNLRGRFEPPVPFYLAAPFVGAEGTGSWQPRIPFAICGLASVAFLLFWFARSRLSAATWIALSAGLLGNVSFFLYCRQCRYYPLAFLLSLVIVYLYLNWDGRWSGIFGMMLASVLLLWTHYLPYAALYTVLACDYLLFARRGRRLKPGQWLLLLGPQLLVGILSVTWLMNPLGAGVVPHAPGRNLLLDKLTLFGWDLRDLNQCEFCVGILLLAVPLVYLKTRNPWLIRGITALLVYTVVAVIFTPQPVEITSVADVRYLSPLIPLCLVLSALVIVSLVQNQWLWALVLSVAIFGFNVLNHPFSPDQWSCRTAEFVGELWNPRATATGDAVRWINEHVRPGASLSVLPDYMESPLMYHAPHPVYAWHLSYPPKEQFADLPPIHFFGQVPPDYFVAFGPFRREAEKRIAGLKERGVPYQLTEVLDIYWQDLTRPEIFWRSFRPIPRFDRRWEAVYIYQRMTPGQTARKARELP